MRGVSETILLVEDEAPVRRSAQRALEAYGYVVLPARDGEEGLQLFREHTSQIDLVISDVIMPRRSGPDLYQAVRAEARAMRFLFTSGYREREVRTNGGFSPSIPFLHKPWTVSELLAQVRGVLDQDTTVPALTGR